jgi:hypothetical protein
MPNRSVAAAGFGPRAAWAGVIACVACAAGVWAGAAAAAAPPSPGSWWQFDRNRFTADETGNGSLVGLPTPSVASIFDTELAFRIVAAPALANGLEASNSFPSFHWSAAGGAMSFVMLHLVVSPVAEGAAQHVAGRWPDEKTGTWRLEVVPTGMGQAVYRVRIGTDAGIVTLEVPAVTDQWRLGFLAIDPAAGTATLEIRTLDGEPAAFATADLPAPPRIVVAPLRIGREPDGVSGDVEVRLDVIAGFPEVLSDDDRRAMVSDGQPQRYISYMGWPGFGPPERHLDRVAGILEGDRRHVVMGDSFAFAAGWNRVFPSILKVRRFEPLTAIAAGVRSPHALISTVSEFDDPAGQNPRAIGQSEQYRCEWLGGSAPADIYGLPANQVTELRAHAGAVVPADGALLRFSVADEGMADGETGRFSEPGQPVSFRLVHRRTSEAVPPLESVRLTDMDDTVSVTLDLTVGPPRQAAAPTQSLTVTSTEDGVTRSMLREATAGDFAAGPERLATLAGIIAVRVDADGERLPGQYYSSLHDSSWSWQDFGRDVESQVPSPLKSISREQLVRWLEATTIDPDQPLTFWWYVDTEDRPETSMRMMMRSAIDTADLACAEAGLGRPVHVVVVPHLHQTSGNRTRDELWEIFARYRAAIDGIVDDPAYDHVSRYSIFDATDGMMFDARPEAVAWLQARGYDAFTYGTVTANLTTSGSLLDSFDAHPTDPLSAAFFASFLGAAIPVAPPPPPACPGDVNTDGVVDFGDLLAVMEAWGPCPPGGACGPDLDGDGLVGILDLLEVLGYWGACPGGG